MSVEVKGGDSSDILKIDATSKAARVTMYDSAGVEVVQSLPISIAVTDVTVVDNDLIGSLDVSAYKFVSLQLTGTWAGTVKFQGSNDNGTFYNIAVQVPDGLATPYVTQMSSVNLVKIPIIFKYLRVRVTAYTSGTMEGVAFGYKEENSTGQISSTGQVTIADGNGDVVGPLITGLEGQEHLPTGMIQDVYLSTVNSTEANLGAAQIFTGVSESTKGVNSIDIMAACNENLTIEIQQSHDGSDFDHGDTFLLAGGTETHRNFKAMAGFSALTPMSEVLPGALSQEGNLKTAVLESLPTGTNILGSLDNVAKLGGVAVSMGGGVSDAGTQRVSIASNEPVGLAAGSELVGHVIVDPSPITMETDLYVGLPGDAAFNGRSIKNSATTLRSFVFTNLAATPRYLKLYDTAGVPTAGAGAPVIIVSLPAVGTLAFPLPVEGFVFANGIGMTMTLKPENSDTTNTATVDFSIVSVFHA